VAIYHLSVKPVSRGGGRSATAASAYRAAELVYDQTTGQTFDYTRKRGVEHSEIVLPTEVTRRDINWARDRQALWNAAEISERRSNSRVAREYEIALPHELTRGQRTELVRSFSQSLADRYRCAVDFSIHAPHREGDERNHHAHLLATTRTIEPGGLGDKTTMEWSDTNRQKAGLGPARQEVTAVRALWAELTNEKLREQALEIRVDHRSLEAQGIQREPTSHLGPAVMEMHRRGFSTDVGRRLEREARESAQKRLELAAEHGRLERERQAVERSILDLSTDVQAAKRERDLALAKDTIQPREAARSIEELQREGREAWLALRAEQQARGPESPEPELSRDAPQQSVPALSLDEQRAQAIEAWRKMREGPTPVREQEHERTQERARPEPELEGPENEP
jgi:ATP-dependent exoDNAse (exonuclease V) alpha subunit